MSYLYGELPKPEAQSCQQHLESCGECREKVAGWQGTQEILDAWQLPVRRRAGARLEVWGRWAVAACAVLTTGFMLGRWSSARPVDLAPLQAQLQPWIKQQVQGNLTQWAPVSAPSVRPESGHNFSEALQAVNKAREDDRQTMADLIGQVDRRQRQESSSLRKDLETVALVAEGRLLKTQEDLGQLASYTQNIPYSRTPVNDRFVYNPKPLE